MKEVNQQNSHLQQTNESWVKPEIVLLSITDITQGNGGGGPDFGSEVS